MSVRAEAAEERVLILAPTGRDGPLAAAVLAESGIATRVCGDVEELVEESGEGVGAVLLTEEALSPHALDVLSDALRTQRPWSNLPVLVFAGSEEGASPAVARLSSFSDVTVFGRPTRKVTLLSATHAALRARRRQYEVRDLLERLRQAVRQRDHFLAVLSHELRNPLAAIVSSTQLLERHGSEASAPERQVIRRQADVLRHLVDDLLEVSRVTAGKINLHPEVVDLAQVVSPVVRSAQAAAGAAGLTVTLEPGEDSAFVLGDAVRLEQIVSNLLTNAIKYTTRGGTIRVEVRADDRWAELLVTDTGVGIREEDLPKIFNLFAQSEMTIEKSQGGLGVGLMLVRRLVELHEGTISASSEGLGKGSTFVVRLPRCDAPAPSAAGARRLERSHSGSRDIQIIEDNEDVREGLRRLLEDEGHRVKTSPDGEAGIALALREKPEFVFVDVGLPGMDGFEVATRLRRELGASVHLVALTGYGSPADRERALAAGFDDHLIKPVAVDTILSLLDRPGSSEARRASGAGSGS